MNFSVAFVAIWFLGFPLLSLYLFFRLKKARRTFAAYVEKAKSLMQQSLDEKDAMEEKYKTELGELRERFANVLDADEEAARVKKEAEDYKASAAKKLSEAQAKTDSALTIAREQARSLVATAQRQANELIQETGAKIQENIDFDKALKALRNKMEGYGSEYILPAQSFLDDLAEEFGFAEAGEALKGARNYSKVLVKAGHAATCEYTEDLRRKTAIAFVIDAFNGKVDSILARMRQDNAGKLIQEVKDACALVNANGQAFRNARISPEYLVARLEEVKWGAAVLELREQAKEEQRAIREQMRDEERARREQERALREALKEEEKASLALEKARLALAQAENEHMREKLEQRIKDLEETYAKAKAREEQAISMAQLTRSGHVYVISNHGAFGGDVVKIGMTRRLEPMERVKELGDASVPFPFDVHAIIYSKDAPALEAELQRRCNLKRVNKVNFRKEFFRMGVEEIKQIVEELGIQAHFTLAAQSKEYMETLAIEQLPLEEQEHMLAPAVREINLRDLLLDSDGETEDDEMAA